MASTVKTADLEASAVEVIGHLKNLQRLKNTKIAVAGGLAVDHYLKYDRDDDIDFIIDYNNPRTIRNELLDLSESPFFLEVLSHPFHYKYKGDKGIIHVRIRLRYFEDYKYMPKTSVPIINADGVIPYAPSTELIVYKIWISGLLPTKQSRDDATACAQGLLEKVKRLLTLDQNQQAMVKQGLESFSEYNICNSQDLV